MQHSRFCFTVLLSVLVLVAGNAARADKIDFSWQSSFTPTSIAPNPAMGARIYFVSESGNGTFTGGGSHDQYAAGVAYFSPTYLPKLANYDYTPFALALKLTDGSSGLSQTLTFHGTVAGSIIYDPPPGMPGQRAAFGFTDWKQSVLIGQDLYHITMQSGAVEAGWGGSTEGPNIIAQIDAVNVYNNPEPSSLLLATMALSMLGLARWKKLATRISKS